MRADKQTMLQSKLVVQQHQLLSCPLQRAAGPALCVQFYLLGS